MGDAETRKDMDMNAALWFWEQSNETMTIRVDCLAGERKPYMTGNDATKYGFDACMYALGVLPPNYPVPAPRELAMIPDMWLRCCSDLPPDTIYYDFTPID
jgi:hypothetical protein